MTLGVNLEMSPCLKEMVRMCSWSDSFPRLLCLLWIKKARAKDKTYICVSVRCKTKILVTVSMAFFCFSFFHKSNESWRLSWCGARSQAQRAAPPCLQWHLALVELRPRQLSIRGWLQKIRELMAQQASKSQAAEVRHFSGVMSWC